MEEHFYDIKITVLGETTIFEILQFPTSPQKEIECPIVQYLANSVFSTISKLSYCRFRSKCNID